MGSNHTNTMNIELEQALKEADKVVETMLQRPYEDQNKFREACLDGVFKKFVETETLDSEMCVALSYFAHCTSVCLASHPDHLKNMQVTMDKETLAELTEQYKVACEAGEDSFNFKGKEIDVKYAKYLIEFLEDKGDLGELMDDLANDNIVPLDEDRKSDR